MLHPLQVEWDADLAGGNPLDWPDYPPSGVPESVTTGRAVIEESAPPVHYAVIAGRFETLGGSMGAVHGERVVRAYRRATMERLPVVVLASSGGARMQEGMIALAQLARTAAAARAHARAGLLSIAVLRGPTTGGVYASYVSLADVRAAEPRAMIGFAGPRVVQVVTGDAPAPDSHRAEAAFAAGTVDALVARDDQAAWIEAALGLRDRPLRLPDADPARGRTQPGAGLDPPAGGEAWAEVLRARAGRRPSGIEQAARLTRSWVELRGPDPTLRAALAVVGDRRVVVIANDRRAGHGRPGPGAFRLARRAIALAGRLGLPLLTLVDTPGADPSAASEAGGIAGEIARTFAAMAELATPSVSVCVGEGGSGGALALAAADRLLMCEHAIFSVIGPEAAAAILHRDASRGPEVADRLALTSADMLRLGLADAVVPDEGPALFNAVHAALATATPGERSARLDRATARWVR